MLKSCRLGVIAALVAVGFSSCAYDSKLENKFHKERAIDESEKIDLKVAIVASEEFRKIIFREEGSLNHSVAIRIGDAFVSVLESEMKSLFREVVVVERASPGVADVTFIPRLDWDVLRRDKMNAEFDYRLNLVAIFRDRDLRTDIALHRVNTIAQYRPTAEIRALSIVAGGTMFLATPITAPLATQAGGKEAERILGESISSVTRKLSNEILSDSKLRDYVQYARPKSQPVQTEIASKPTTTGVDSLQSSGRRVALVIGNGNYGSIGRLRNPVNDARAVAEHLGRFGFEVTKIENGDRLGLIRAVVAHARQLRNAEAGVVFFAGHGMQVRGVNYLMPIEADRRSEGEVEANALAFPWLMQQLADAGARTNVLILDACRNNPLHTAFRSSMRGLAVVGRAPSNMLVLYATAPDDVAADGDGANGLFTYELLRHLDQQGVEVVQK